MTIKGGSFMDIIDRFIEYIKIPTTSDPKSNTYPSTKKQLVLAKLLKEQLKDLTDKVILTDTGIVYAFLNSNYNTNETIGLIAHMDTSPDMSDEFVKPRIIHNYDGSIIKLNEKIFMDPKDFTSLKNDIGADIMVTDGNTLLGGDDKAGIAIIMDVLTRLKQDKNFKHKNIVVAFTPDEEIGRGCDNFDLSLFNADYAYTIDGGAIDDIEYENFNASSAKVTIKGCSIHPGSAKNKMLNSILIAMEFNSLLPVKDNPMYTEGYEGFNHLCDINGDCEKTVMEYIIRNHDLKLLEKQKDDFRNACAFINKKYPNDTCTLEIIDTYKNMKEYLKDHMDIVDNVKKIMKDMGLKASSTPIRGGTDGAVLTYKGLPCPNLGNGDRNCHGKFEYVNLNEMKMMSDLLLKLVA